MKHPNAGSGRRLIAPSAVSRRRFLEIAGKAGAASEAFLVASAAWRAQAAGEPLKIGSKGPFAVRPAAPATRSRTASPWRSRTRAPRATCRW